MREKMICGCRLDRYKKFAKWNNGFKYILLVIDTFSKYVWLRPLKQKTGQDVTEAFKDIMVESGRRSRRLITDKGQELRAKKVQELMKKHDAIYSPIQNETKAIASERAIQTIKIMRYLNYKDNYMYLPIIDDIVESYNQTFHRTIGVRPIDVKETNQEEVRLSTYFTHNKGKGTLN